MTPARALFASVLVCGDAEVVRHVLPVFAHALMCEGDSLADGYRRLVKGRWVPLWTNVFDDGRPIDDQFDSCWFRVDTCLNSVTCEGGLPDAWFDVLTAAGGWSDISTRHYPGEPTPTWVAYPYTIAALDAAARAALDSRRSPHPGA